MAPDGLQMARDGSRWLQMDGSRWLQIVPDASGLLQMASDDFRFLQMAADSSPWPLQQIYITPLFGVSCWDHINIIPQTSFA